MPSTKKKTAKKAARRSPTAKTGGRTATSATAKKTAAKAAPVKKTTALEIPQMDLRQADLYLIGTTELVVHNWSRKSLSQMEDKDGQKPRQARGRRNPKEECESAKYVLEDGSEGFPGGAFRLAMIDAGTSVQGLQKTAIRQALHVVDDYVVINGPPAQMRQDTVRLSGPGRTASLRYRPGYKDWWVVLRVQYNAGMLSEEQLINLANLAGFAVGIGEHRPQKGGSWGRFRVATEDDVKSLRKPRRATKKRARRT